MTQSRAPHSVPVISLHFYCTSSPLSNCRPKYFLVTGCHSAMVIPHTHPSVQILLFQPSRVRFYWSVCWHSFVSSSKGVRECDSVHIAWRHDGSATFLFNSVYEGGQWAAVLSGSVTLKAPVCLWPLAWWNTMLWREEKTAPVLVIVCVTDIGI